MESYPVVSLLRKSLVVPATPTKTRHFFLSCLDIFWQDIHYNRRIIFYKSSGSDFSSAIEILKRSLSVVLVHFYPWAGRLAFGEDRRLMIDCNDFGVEFVEASIDFPISALEKDDFQMKVFFDNLCQHVECTDGKLLTNPLLSVQTTRFSDGGLAIAFAQSHVVADGQSLWHFMVSWGECARGEKLSLEPLHDRAMLALPDPSSEKTELKLYIEEDDEPTEKVSDEATASKTVNMTKNRTTTEIPTESITENETTMDFKNGNVTTTEKPTENIMATDSEKSSPTVNPIQQDAAIGEAPDPLVQHSFYMSEATIKELKREAAQTTGHLYSSYELLASHFWQRVTIARRRPASERVSFAVLSNYRGRLKPPLPSSYFGNVISILLTKSDAGTISGESVGAIAERIHAVVAASTDQRLRSMMHWLELHDNRLVPEFKLEGSCVQIASSPWFPVYRVDFGWGKPAAVRAAKVPGNGEMVLFGGRPGSHTGDVEICMALEFQTLQNLLEDPLFRAAST